MTSLTVVATRYLAVVGVAFACLDIAVRTPWYYPAWGFASAGWFAGLSAWTRRGGGRSR